MEANQTIYYDYTVKAGDSLSTILYKMYGVVPGNNNYQKSLDFVLQINPEIKNPNLIYPGQNIHLGVISNQVSPQSNPQVSPLEHLATWPLSRTNENSVVDKVSKQDSDYFWALSWLEHHSPGLVIPGSIATGATQNLLSPGNTRMISEISDLYAEYKQGTITRGQYDYRRISRLNDLKNNFGPMEKVLFGGKTSREAVRIARGGGVPATSHIQKHANRLNQIARMGKYGGIVLAGVGVTASCMQIANTADRKEKNEIFVETLGSTVSGGISGVLVGAFLVSNPVGWGTALILATGSVALSYLSGKYLRHLYDTRGNRVDLVSGLGIDSVCK